MLTFWRKHTTFIFRATHTGEMSQYVLETAYTVLSEIAVAFISTLNCKLLRCMWFPALDISQVVVIISFFASL